MVRRGRWRVLFEQVHHHLHGLLELRVVSLAQRFRNQFHLDVRRDAVALHAHEPLGL